jgi:transketolase
MNMHFGPRRAQYIDISEDIAQNGPPLNAANVGHYETFDMIYRSLCALLYNYVPLSGHPGGSISSGRFVGALLFDALDYDISDPEREDADIISYAAGHKALGLYAMWALRNEAIRIANPGLLPSAVNMQLRLEDLLGFRRNPLTETPLFRKFNAKALDGHPTPATPFVRLATGASGVGIATSLGLAFAARDYYGRNAPMVHIVEGEGGMTPGRVSEAFAAAGTASLKNAVVHIDWNQASIDSNRVCRDGGNPGDYVQWDPAEFAYLHDWNVVLVHDGKDYQQILAAQRKVNSLQNSQPTAIVYRTTKGWQYGIEGRKSHGAGHALCSETFYSILKPLLEITGTSFPECKNGAQRCKAGIESEILEECFWNALTVIRDAFDKKRDCAVFLVQRLAAAKTRLDDRARKPRREAPSVDTVYELAQKNVAQTPTELMLSPGTKTTLRGELGRVLNYYNKASSGSLFTASADLLGSTSVTTVSDGFAEGFFNADTNQDSRTLSIGGICEDAQAGIMAGISTYGHHIGVCSSYGAFIAVLGHIASRLHAIGCEAKKRVTGEAFKPFFLVCAHAGIKTGEDGPTHADPQPLQVVQENFPRGTVITLTPWDPQELSVLVSAALSKRPAVICPFVTRPTETVVDRKSAGLAQVEDAASGIYLLHRAEKKGYGCIVLQGSEVATEFVTVTLHLLLKDNIDIDVYYIASAELFDMLPKIEQRKIFSGEQARYAMGITGFTLPTMYRWITSERGRDRTLYPFKNGHFLGSGRAEMVLKEAGLDGRSQYIAIADYLSDIKNTN